LLKRPRRSERDRSGDRQPGAHHGSGIGIQLDQPFAVYWVKASENDGGTLNKSLAKLCRQEDIVCRNGDGEFVAILSGTDSDGVKGFESRLEEKLGERFDKAQHGYSLYNN